MIKSGKSRLARFNRKMSFHFPWVVLLISDRSVWHNGSNPNSICCANARSRCICANTSQKEDKMTSRYITLDLEISGSGRAHAFITNVQCSQTQDKYHMEEITGTVLHIYRNYSFIKVRTELSG